MSDTTVADPLFADVFRCDGVAMIPVHLADLLRAQNNEPVISGRKNRKVKIAYNKAIYRLCSRIEQFFGKLKENR